MAGYEKLVVYWLATTIYDLTAVFCDRFIDKRSRTHDQMVQAARSGKQNIVEGNIGKSVETNLKLTGVARNSFSELLEDYKDYLRQHSLPLWGKDDPRVMEIRTTKDLQDTPYKSYTTYTTYINDPQSFCNLLVTLCSKEGYLLDRFLAAVEEKFIKEGGFKENLFKKRLEYRNKNS
ncbi:MAG: four helix bundle suffix domain-containing protein [Patescibacteria group bacterium]